MKQEIGVGGSFVIGVVGAGIGGLEAGKLLAKAASVDGVVFVAIADRFSGVPFEDFVQLDVLHEAVELALLAEQVDDAQVLRTGSELCAALYRKTKREKLDMATIRHRARDWARADPEAVAAVVADYRRMRKWLANLYPLLFQGGEAKSGNIQPQALRQWPQLRDAYAEALGITAEAANKTLLHDVLRFLNNKLKRK